MYVMVPTDYSIAWRQARISLLAFYLRQTSYAVMMLKLCPLPESLDHRPPLFCMREISA